MFRALRRLFGRLFRRRDRTTPPLPPTGEETARSNDSGPPTDPINREQPSDRTETPMPNITPGSTTGAKDMDSLKQVLNVLRAYIVTFGSPASALELRAIVGAVVANLKTVAIDNADLEGFIDEAVAAFESIGADPALVDVTAQLLAEQVAVWIREQETTVSNVVSAYLQQFAPMGKAWPTGEVISLVQTVIATLNDGSLSRSGGRFLVDRVVETFDLERAISRWVAPEWVGLAQRVARYLEKGDLQSELRAIAWSYVQQFQAILSPQLIEQIMTQGPLNVSPAELLSGDLGEFSQMLYYKFQLLEADPVVTKSHEAIAADVHRAIADLRSRREPVPDITKGVQTGDLEISSPFVQGPRSRAE